MLSSGDPDGPEERSFAGFLARLARLTSDEARALAEIDRVSDWDLDRRSLTPARTIELLLGGEEIAQWQGERLRGARKRARRIAETNTVIARSRVEAALRAARPTWRGKGLGDAMIPIIVLAIIGIGVSVLANIVRPSGAPGGVVIGALVAYIVAAVGAHLLPPGGRGLRRVVTDAALAHAALPTIDGDAFDALTDRWYAVVDRGWRRGPRPYLVWGCLIVGTLLLVVFGYLVNAAYESLYPGD